MTIRPLLSRPAVSVFCLLFYSFYCWQPGVFAQQRPPLSAIELVNQMVQAESSAGRNREHFIYRRVVRSARTKGHLWDELVVETPDGRMHRLIAEDGKPLSTDQQKAEDDRIRYLANHPDAFRKEAQGRKDDEARMTVLLQELPRAFLFHIEGADGDCTRIAFAPNPSFQEQTYQDRVVHAMSGVLRIHTADMRLCGIDAHLDHKVQFGFGLLGEVSDGSNFSIAREPVSAGQWKTIKLRIHVGGSMLLLKSFARDEEASHYGFKQVADHLTVAQAAALVRSHSF
jgi:hypothetical protein